MPRAPRDLLRLYRVADWLHFLPLPLAGWMARSPRTPRELAGALLSWTGSLAFMSAVNQAFDDRLDRRAGKNPVGSGLDRAAALRLAALPALVAVAASASLAPAGLAATAALLVAATVYSAPPRLKRVPVVGTLWNVVIALPGMVLAGAPQSPSPRFATLAALFAGLLLGSQLLHEAEDRDDDRAGGVTTVAVLFGARGALGAALAVVAPLPLAPWLLDPARPAATLATALFAAGWCAVLARRIALADTAALRQLRLRYRWSALALGAAVFASVA